MKLKRNKIKNILYDPVNPVQFNFSKNRIHSDGFFDPLEFLKEPHS
jgi:hypothetical protein